MATFYNLIPKWLLASACVALAGLFGFTLTKLSLAESSLAQAKEARAQDQAAFAQAQNDALREMAREVSRLIDVNNNLQVNYAKTAREIDAAERLASGLSDRLRQSEKARAAAIEAADPESRGRYAADLGAILGSCQLEYQSLGFAAARCAAAAHTLKEAYDAVTDGASSMPPLPALPELPTLPN